MSDPGTGISNFCFPFLMKLDTEGANGTVRLTKLVILMLDSPEHYLVLTCLHVNVTVNTFVTVLLNTFDMSINNTTAVIIQYQINTHTSNDIV
jgi:hypothetical protein